jgi:hypothetical protein
MTMIIDGTLGLEFPDNSDQTTAFTGNAATITSGTIATARLATGTANSSTYLRGDQTWATVPATTPGGSTTQVQFNNAGAFGGNSSFVYTGGNVGIGTASPINNSGYGGLTLNGTSGALFSLMTNGTETGRIASLSDETSVQCRATTGYINFVQGVSGGTERMRITAAGGLAFGGASNFGSSGQLLQSNGNAVPTWVTPTINGTAKAWVSFNGTNGSIRGSFNVSSVSRNGTGEYTVNFTSALSTANYAKTCTPSGINGQGDLTAINTDRMNSSFTAPTTTAFKIWTKVIGSSQDPEYVSAAAFA